MCDAQGEGGWEDLWSSESVKVSSSEGGERQ